MKWTQVIHGLPLVNNDMRKSLFLAFFFITGFFLMAFVHELVFVYDIKIPSLGSSCGVISTTLWS